jgi:hypothetical protein
VDKERVARLYSIGLLALNLVAMNVKLRYLIWMNVYKNVPRGMANQSPGSFVEKTDNFLPSRKWLKFFKFYLEVGLECAIFMG